MPAGLNAGGASQFSPVHALAAGLPTMFPRGKLRDDAKLFTSVLAQLHLLRHAAAIYRLQRLGVIGAEETDIASGIGRQASENAFLGYK